MSIHELFQPNLYDLFCDTLTANNITFSGSTVGALTVSPGPLTVNGSSALNGPVLTGALTVAGNETVSGTSTLSGDVVIGATTPPGPSATLTVNGQVTIKNPGNFQVNGSETITGNSDITGAQTVFSTSDLKGNVTIGTIPPGAPANLTVYGNVSVPPPGGIIYDNTLVSPNTLNEAAITNMQNAFDRIQSYTPRALGQANLAGATILMSGNWAPITTTFLTGSGQSRPQSNLGAYWGAGPGPDGIQGNFSSYGAAVVYHVSAIIVVNGPFTLPVSGFGGIGLAIVINGTQQFTSFGPWDGGSVTQIASVSGTVISAANSVFTVQAFPQFSAGPYTVASCVLYVEYDGNI